jgi:hypothetical protein
MGHKGIIRIFILFIAAASFVTLGVRAQDEPSVADAARRARQQKQASAKPSSVITDDTLRPAPATAAAAPSALPAEAPAPTAQASTEAAESAERKASETDDEAEQKKRDIAKLKEEIAQKQQQLKFLKSDLALKQDTFYSNPDHQHDADGKNKLDSVKSDIKQAEDELAALQAKISDLGPAAEAKPTPPSRP